MSKDKENKKDNYNLDIYKTLTSYEISIFFGVLSRYYFTGSSLKKEEREVTDPLLRKIQYKHISSNVVKNLVRAMKNCISKDFDINYENLSKDEGFSKAFKDKTSFLRVIEYQSIPTLNDIEAYSSAVDLFDSEGSLYPSVLDIVLKNDKLKDKFPDLERVVTEVKELIDSSKSTDKDYTLRDGSDLMREYREEMVKRDRGEGFYTSGFTSIDRYLYTGLAPKQITIVAARPGMGKSAFVINMMKNLAARKVHTGQFVLEMDSISFLDRAISSMTKISSEKIMKYREILSDDERVQLEFAENSIASNKYLYLNDTPAPSLKDLKKSIKKFQDKTGSKYCVIVIDLFDKVKDNLTASSSLTSNFHMSLNDIQTMAKELEVHFVLVAQIHRENEKKEDKRPSLSNLKHSGAFEEVADLVFFLDRPSYRVYKEDNSSFSEEYVPSKYEVTGFDYPTLKDYLNDKNKNDDFSFMGDLDPDLEEGTLPDEEDVDSVSERLSEDNLMKVGDLVIPITQYAEVILAKQRRGPGGIVIPFIFQGQYSSFMSLELVSPVKSDF